MGRRLAAEAGCGLDGPAGLGVATPYGGLSLADGDDRTWRAGLRWALAPDVALGVEGRLREVTHDDAPDRGLLFHGTARW